LLKVALNTIKPNIWRESIYCTFTIHKIKSERLFQDHKHIGTNSIRSCKSNCHTIKTRRPLFIYAVDKQNKFIYQSRLTYPFFPLTKMPEKKTGHEKYDRAQNMS
jgi:hypothetical protein